MHQLKPNPHQQIIEHAPPRDAEAYRAQQIESFRRMRKSKIGALLLTVCFGPLGFFYVDSSKAGWFTVISILSFGLGLLVIWPMSIFMSMPCVVSYNERLAISLGLPAGFKL